MGNIEELADWSDHTPGSTYRLQLFGLVRLSNKRNLWKNGITQTLNSISVTKSRKVEEMKFRLKVRALI